MQLSSESIARFFAGWSVAKHGSRLFTHIIRVVPLRKWALACALQFLSGLVFQFVIFVLIVQSTTVIGMLLNFAGKDYRWLPGRCSSMLVNLFVLHVQHWDSSQRLMMWLLRWQSVVTFPIQSRQRAERLENTRHQTPKDHGCVDYRYCSSSFSS